jgi:hypothetical protein
MRRKRLLMIAPLAIVGMAAFLAVGGEVVRQLWNWLAPAVFGWQRITFWQALGLLALCRILFGGFGGHGGYRGKFRQRMEGMTEEERERFRQGIRGRCGFSPAGGESGGQ